MRHAWILLPLLTCLVLGAPARAEEEAAPDTKAAVRDALKTKVSVHFEEVTVQEAVEYVGAATGLDIRVDPKIEQTVTIRFEQASAGAVLEWIAEAAGLEVKLTKKGGLVLYRAKEKGAEPKGTKRRKMADAEEARVMAWLAELAEGMKAAEAKLIEAREQGDDEAMHELAKHMDELRAKRKQLLEKRKALRAKPSRARLVPAPPIPPMPPRTKLDTYREAIEKLKVAEAARKRAEDDLAARKGEIEQLVKKANALRQRGAELRELGREDEAKAHLREADELFAQARQLKKARFVHVPGDYSTSSRKTDPAHREAMERLEHLRLALRSLHAAGLHEQAEQVEREIHGLERRLEAREREHGASGDVMHALRELQREVRSLRADVRGLTELIKQLMAKETARR